MNTILLPNYYFADPLKSRPLVNASVYIGEPNLDPEANPKAVFYVDSQGNQTAAPNPVLTGAGGVVVDANSLPVQVVTDGEFSIKVRDNLGALKYHTALVEAGSGAVSFVEMGGYTELVTEIAEVDASISNLLKVGFSVTPITVINVPDGAYTLTIQLTDVFIDLSALSIKWQGGTVPTYTAEIDLIFLTSSDNGATWLGSASTGYV